jgi:hypothetical protein
VPDTFDNRRRFRALDLGPLPVELVNSVLRCTLAPGRVLFSAANQDHAYGRHAEKYLACRAHIAATVVAPHFIGQSPHHPDGFEMVRAVGEGGHILVALTLFPADAGRYPIQSVYPIGRNVVYKRVRTGHLFRV